MTIEARQHRWPSSFSDRVVAHHVMIAALALAALAVTSGCALNWPNKDSELRPAGVFVVHVPGIAGVWGSDRALARGLLEAGVEEVELFAWTGPFVLANLMDTSRHAAQASRLAARLRAKRIELPDAQIVVTAHSGGVRVALLAVESLDLGQEPAVVDQLWLLSPAVQPDYDLSAALARVQRIVAVVSERDGLFLGLGTRLFGTADRYFGEAAGRTGFTVVHPRFEEVSYQKQWAQLGYHGGHLGSLARKFAHRILGPAMIDRISPLELELEAVGEANPSAVDYGRLGQPNTHRAPVPADATGQAATITAR